MNSGGKRYASETSSQRSSITRNCVDKADGTMGTSSAAILNNVVRFAADIESDSPWASLDRYGRTRRPRRLPVWAADESDDEGPRTDGCDDTGRPVDEAADGGDVHQETMLSSSLTSVQAVVDDFDDSSAGHSPISRRVSPLSRDVVRTPANSVLLYKDDVCKSNRTKVATAAATLSWKSGPFLDVGVGSALAAKASSEGDVLAGVDAAETPAGRSSRLLSSASALFGRLMTQTRQRLTTVSGADWRRRCDVALKRSKQFPSSESFYDASTTSKHRRKISRQPGAQTAAAVPDEEEQPDETCEMRLPSLFGSVDSTSSRRRSQRRDANTPAARPVGGYAAALDVPTTVTGAGARWDHEVLQRTRSSKNRPSMRRYPSVERLDLPRRQSEAVSGDDRSPFGADRKRAERFRRQYIDVKLQRQATPLQQPTSTTKSMPTGVDICGTARRDVVATQQLPRIPATASVPLT